MSQKHEWVNPHNEVKLLLHKIAFVALNKLFSRKLVSFGKGGGGAFGQRQWTLNNLSRVAMVQFLLTGPNSNKVKIDILKMQLRKPEISKQENEWPIRTLQPMADVIRCWTERFKRRTHDPFLLTNFKRKILENIT